ncbi:MAG: hypothetical protein Q9226_007386 [Calogaya cf. arnoldii]
MSSLQMTIRNEQSNFLLPKHGTFTLERPAELIFGSGNRFRFLLTPRVIEDGTTVPSPLQRYARSINQPTLKRRRSVLSMEDEGMVHAKPHKRRKLQVENPSKSTSKDQREVGRIADPGTTTPVQQDEAMDESLPQARVTAAAAQGGLFHWMWNKFGVYFI